MAFRNFQFMFHHSMRVARAPNITSSDPYATDHPVDHFFDNRRGAIARFDGATANQNVFWDRGTGFAQLPSIDRLIVPAHNFDLAGTLEVEEDTDSAFDETLSLNLLSVDPGFLDVHIPVPLTKRFIKIEWPNATVAWEASQLMFTNTLTFVTGPNLGDSPDALGDNADTFTKASGKAPSLVRGPQQRRFVVTYERLQGADLVSMEAFIAEVGTHAPFWVDPPQFGHFTTLTTGINTTVDNTPKAVVDASEFPDAGTFILQMGQEELLCSKSSPTAIFIESGRRAQNGTTAERHEPGDVLLELEPGAVMEFPRWMKMERDAVGTLATNVPKTGIRKKTITLSLIDHLD